MLITEYVKITWNSKIVKHYTSLGYKYTKIGDTCDVKVSDLTRGSSVKVTVECDYCGKHFEKTYGRYLHEKEKSPTDCCSNQECINKKIKDSFTYKYGEGITSCRQLDFVNEKIKQTNIEKYGCENPFGNKDVQEKIKNYYLTNYGVEYSMQIPEIVEKAKQTSLAKYGVTSHTKTKEYRERFSGENSPVWVGDKVKNHRTERQLPEYRDWRKAVFDRDYYTCKRCGARNGNGTYIRLEAHHIKNWMDNEDCRFDVDNGITLCSNCHQIFHHLFGKCNNDEIQLEVFLYNEDKKIC